MKAIIPIAGNKLLCVPFLVGAKLMKRETYTSIKDKLSLKGFAFDVELLWRARLKGFVVQEVPINWRFVLGHTFKPYRSGFKVVKELVALRFR